MVVVEETERRNKKMGNPEKGMGTIYRRDGKRQRNRIKGIQENAQDREQYRKWIKVQCKSEGEEEVGLHFKYVNFPKDLLTPVSVVFVLPLLFRVFDCW